MKIYFAGSIRGGRGNTNTYFALIEELKKYGEVLTEFLGDKNLAHVGQDMPSKDIYEKDINLIHESNVLVAEVSTPSLGVGYELAFAERLDKRILCLYKPEENKKLSAMIGGNKNFSVKEYADLAEAFVHIRECFR